MISLEAKIRNIQGKKTKELKRSGVIPAILYGPEISNALLEVDLKNFKKVFKEAGENTMISLKTDGSGKKDYAVLIKQVVNDPISSEPIHIDFYQPNLSKELEADIPLEFIGAAPALQLGGTLVKNMHELKVKSLPQNLPHSIKIDVSGLNTFEDSILVKDVHLPENVKIMDNLEETVVKVMEPEKVEEELAKPAEEGVENIEKVEKKKKEEAGEEESK
ncbi:MAG: 50S ribosomal protein L25 [Candidatus Paceibacterota bacterium]|jgi:large subunit ribosomal protein L25